MVARRRSGLMLKEHPNTRRQDNECQSGYGKTCCRGNERAVAMETQILFRCGLDCHYNV